MSVYQEAIYSINHEFDTDVEVKLAKTFLKHNQPVCTGVEWINKEVTISNFDHKSSAEYVYESLINYVNSRLEL